MKIGFQEVCINPLFPVKRMKQEITHQKVADTLYGRILYLEADKRKLYHISIDTVEIQRTYREKIIKMMEEVLHEEIDLIVSATHSHNCPCLTTDEAYQAFVLEKLKEGILKMQYQDLPVSISHHYEYFDAIGKSRVQGMNSDCIYAEVLSFWHQDRRLGSILIHNVHPTIETLWKHDFTAEYPGTLIKILKARFPGEFFTFVMGPAGDISPRYVRRNQEHQEMLRLSTILADEFEKLLTTSKEKTSVTFLQYEEVEVPIQRIHRTITNAHCMDALDEEEQTLIKNCLLEPIVKLDELPSSHLFSRLLFPNYVMIFEPFELYSEYYHVIQDKEVCSLVTISNGYDDYVTGIGEQPLSFAYLKDTVADETKIHMINLLNKWSMCKS